MHFANENFPESGLPPQGSDAEGRARPHLDLGPITAKADALRELAHDPGGEFDEMSAPEP